MPLSPRPQARRSISTAASGWEPILVWWRTILAGARARRLETPCIVGVTGRLRQSGLDVREVSQRLKKKSWSYQNELLFQHGINFNELPLWQRRGVGLYWETIEKEGLRSEREQGRPSSHGGVSISTPNCQ